MTKNTPPYILIRGEMPGAHGLLWWAVLSDGSTIFNEPGRSISGAIRERANASVKGADRPAYRGHGGSDAVRRGYLQGRGYDRPHHTIRAIVDTLPNSNA